MEGSAPGPDHGGDPARPSVQLASELTGRLPCVGCGYELAGLSILGSCPECQTAVRATLLTLVDPRAEQLVPIHRPRVVASGMILWASGAMLTCLLAWAARIDELSVAWFNQPIGLPHPWPGVGVLLASSALGALVFLNPHRDISQGIRLRTLAGIGSYVGLIASLWWLYAVVDGGVAMPTMGAEGMSPERTAARLTVAACAAVVILGLRPVARGLAMRSVVVRTGRVDRQSMLALLSSFGIAAVGDLLGLLSGTAPGDIAEWLVVGHLMLVAVGSVLITLGLFGVLLDCVRLRAIILSPGIGYDDILGAPGPAAGGSP